MRNLLTTTAAALLVTITMAACKPDTNTWAPTVETYSTECRKVDDKSHTRSKLNGQVCDLYERIAALEKRLAALESSQ